MAGEIKTNVNWHLNTSVDFTINGVWLRVSLNIEPGLAKFLSPNNVKKGKERTVYALRTFIESPMICLNTMRVAQQLLLDNCMRNIRDAKEKQRLYKLQYGQNS